MRRSNAESPDTFTAKLGSSIAPWPRTLTVSESTVEFRPYRVSSLSEFKLILGDLASTRIAQKFVGSKGWCTAAAKKRSVGSLQRRRLAQSLGHELRTRETQSSMSKRSSSDVSAACLKPRTALTSKCAAL
jgi:hypothetical protein